MVDVHKDNRHISNVLKVKFRITDIIFWVESVKMGRMRGWVLYMFGSNRVPLG